MINLEIPAELVDNGSHEINYENLKNKILIGLCGYARSGKDTVAKALVKKLGFKRISFADTLKEDLNEFFRVQVFEDLTKFETELEFDQIDFVSPATPEIKETLRPYMIWFGEKMKEINGVHHWTNRAFSKIEESDKKLVVTDVRRLNEIEIFRNSKEFQITRNRNREDLGISIPSIYEVESEFDSLLLYVNQLHNDDDDTLTQQTILRAMQEWVIADTIYIDSRIQNITDYHEKHISIQVRKLVNKYPDYFI
jgi:hypothetical protein